MNVLKKLEQETITTLGSKQDLSAGPILTLVCMKELIWKNVPCLVRLIESQCVVVHGEI